MIQSFGAQTEKALSPYVLVLQVGCILGLESSSEETELISDVRGVPLDIAGKDYSVIYKQREDVVVTDVNLAIEVENS